jgi:hypothetical protein
MNGWAAPMAHDVLRDSALARSLTDALGDFSDLIGKEVRLAKAEIAEKIATKLTASIWMVAAGVLGFIAALVLVQAAVLAIASFGIALHWACLLVAAVLVALAAAAFFHARSAAAEDLTPSRSITQITKDIATIKEQLT